MHLIVSKILICFLFLQCYSKFGDVVFTLTRFFRDGRDRGPTKLKLLEIKECGKSCPVNTQMQVLRILYPLFLTPPNFSILLYDDLFGELYGFGMDIFARFKID